jgi:hypothetical protein
MIMTPPGHPIALGILSTILRVLCGDLSPPANNFSYFFRESILCYSWSMEKKRLLIPQQPLANTSFIRVLLFLALITQAGILLSVSLVDSFSVSSCGGIL